MSSNSEKNNNSSNASSTYPKSNSSTIARMLAHRLTNPQEYRNPSSSSSTITNDSLQRASADLRFRFTNHYQPWNSSLAPSLNLLPRFSTSTSTSSATTTSSNPSSTSDANTDSGNLPAECPMSKNNDTINPLNQMPNLSQTALSKTQRIKLSTQRTVSSIPKSSSSPSNPAASPYDKGDENQSSCPIPHDQRSPPSDGSSGSSTTATATSSPIGTKEIKSDKWEYPSPQQFYNALVRKGWATPEDSVETMVLIHNVLNERAWDEVIRWERELVEDCDSTQLSLTRFTGRPGTLSPKARIFNWLGWVMPNRFNSTPPFDRHDWIVRRSNGVEVRYVIDYYSDEHYDETQSDSSPSSSSTSGGLVSKAESTAKRVVNSHDNDHNDDDDDDDDEASFNLDVRPALDSFDAFNMRFRRTWKEWKEGNGNAES